jgi:hypothetical protein
MYRLFDTHLDKKMMNERIKLLADEAGIKRVDLHYTEEQPPYTIVSYRGSLDNTDPLTKFAELIVRECIGVVEGGSFLHDQAPTAIFARECSGAIKRHFGVEE